MLTELAREVLSSADLPDPQAMFADDMHTHADHPLTEQVVRTIRQTNLPIRNFNEGMGVGTEGRIAGQHPLSWAEPVEDLIE